MRKRTSFESTLARSCIHPKTVILDIYEQKTFSQMMRLRFVTKNGWLLVKASDVFCIFTSAFSGHHMRACTFRSAIFPAKLTITWMKRDACVSHTIFCVTHLIPLIICTVNSFTNFGSKWVDQKNLSPLTVTTFKWKTTPW